jgi:3-methylfumaryl-CoA hydratase
VRSLPAKPSFLKTELPRTPDPRTLTHVMTTASAGTSEPDLRDWIGRTETRSDYVAAAPLAALAATLDRDDPEPLPGCEAPPLAHWLFFQPAARQSDLDADGHPRRGGFLPPVPLPRRMWAGGRLAFHHPLRVGDDITRESRIAAVETKAGRSGPLVFVTVHHAIANAHGVAISEEQDLVYRAAPLAGAAAPAPQPAPRGATCSRTVAPDATLLFRYSALTFNAHRIHYDRDYATGVEGYPGLVVHGPLIATLLADLLRRQRPRDRLTHFSFSAVRPLIDTRPFDVCAQEDDGPATLLWAQDADGALAMRAEARTERA